MQMIVKPDGRARRLYRLADSVSPSSDQLSITHGSYVEPTTGQQVDRRSFRPPTARSWGPFPPLQGTHGPLNAGGSNPCWLIPAPPEGSESPI